MTDEGILDELPGAGNRGSPQLPLVILAWRDAGYGVIRWKEMLRYGCTSSVGFDNLNLVAYAQAFGAAGFRVEGPSELTPILQECLGTY